MKGFGYFKLGEKVIRAVEYADGLVQMTKEETVLKDVIDRLMEIDKMLQNGNECGRRYGNENVKATVPKSEHIRSRITGECGIL